MLRKTLRAAGLGLAFLVLATTGWIAWGSRDLPRVDDADLRVERAPLAPEQNLFTHLQRLVAEHPDDDGTARELLGAERLDRAAARRFLSRHAGTLRDLESLLHMPRLQIPPHDWEDSDCFSDLCSLQHLARTLALRSWLQAEQGDREAAVRDALLILELGRRLEEATGASLLSVMVAHAVKKIGVRAIDRVSRVADFEGPEARALALRLDGYRSDPDAWARMWAVEYQSTKSLLLSRLVEADDPLAGVDGERPPWWLPTRYMLHPQRTLQRWADAYRRLAGSAGSCRPPEEAPWWKTGSSLEKLRIVLSPNGAGEVMFAIAQPDYGRFTERRCLLGVELGATQLRLALRAWRRRHGALPERLDRLLPDYLGSLPRDDFDGRPLRYDPEAGRVWSVGTDLRDAGGLRTEGEEVEVEPAFEI